jgi:hypothetical protein
VSGVVPHDAEVQTHDEQVPLVGPEELPVAQVDVPWQKPQEVRVVQSEQLVELAQGSEPLLPSQSAAHQSQLEQLPELGPLALPCLHVEFAAQKPQRFPESAVHDAQSRCAAQGSVGSPGSVLPAQPTQSQSIQSQESSSGPR